MLVLIAFSLNAAGIVFVISVISAYLLFQF